MSDNEIVVFDVGDSSVGIPSLNICDIELNEEFLALMKEQNTLADFRHDLKELVSRYFEAETSYDTYMIDDDFKAENTHEMYVILDDF